MMESLRLRHLRAPVSALLAIVAGLAAMAGSASGWAGTDPSTVTVTTSRGEFKLFVYAPAAPLPDAAPRKAPMVLLISGEGGWRRFDDLVCGYLRDAGYWTGGIDSMKYFWKAQDDRAALASDVRAYADTLAASAGRPAGGPIVLAGFSFGADLAPWVAGGGGWGDRIKGLLMMGPDETGSLEFRLMEILGFNPKDHTFPVAEALTSAAGIPVIFVHGGKDSSSAAPALVQHAAEPKKLVVIPGADHHFSGQEDDLRRALLEGLSWIEAGAPPPAAGHDGGR
jgi:type IV secretory pathway VirJ component